MNHIKYRYVQVRGLIDNLMGVFMNNFKIILCFSALLIGSASHAMDLNTQGIKLRAAASGGSLERVKELLDAGAPVDAKNNNGLTALIYAAVAGEAEVCQLLIEYNAQVDAESNDGCTALASSGCQEVRTVFVDAMLKRIKDNSVAIALLGMRKFRNVACMNPIDYKVIQLIACQIPIQKKQKLFELINETMCEDTREYFLRYIGQKLKTDPKTTQGSSHE